jgi:class 3 adenylate cyclase
MNGDVPVRFCERLGETPLGDSPGAIHRRRHLRSVGAPISHEDHPQRALYAALRMQKEMRRYGDWMRTQEQTPLRVRVGVNTGQVVVRSIQTGAHTEYTPIGHSTSLAARLQTLATPGSTVISGYTRGFVEGYFQLKSLGPTRVKGSASRSRSMR